jgi:peroxin-19
MSIPGLGSGLDLDTAEELDEDGLSEAFSRELQKGMESLMRELGNPSSSGSVGDKDHLAGEQGNEEAERMFKAAWEAMLVEGMDGMVQGSANEKSSTSQTGPKAGDGEPSNAFQDQIRQAMDKLRESESNLQVLPSATVN